MRTLHPSGLPKNHCAVWGWCEAESEIDRHARKDGSPKVVGTAWLALLLM